ncbi:cytochrome b [Komagataeibacter diospyri]|uniref:cytochrome b n=1 Tax=Komagataeibacter diospyri TaxID=1932662 RepID=UPI003757FE82
MLLPVRIAWRIGWGRQMSASDRWLGSLLACSVEYSLYGLAMMEIGLGYLWRWGNGQAMSFLSGQVMPPFGKFAPARVGLLHQPHQWNGWLIIFLATGHALAACFHYFTLRDNVLQRMFMTGNISNGRK